MNGIENLLFKEDDHLRSFLSESFNFIYDKDTYTAMSWGSARDDNALYDPIGPELIDMVIGKDYVFDESIFRLISLPIEESQLFASTLVNVRLHFKDASMMYSEEVKKLYDALTSRSIYVEYCIPNKYISNMKNMMKLKMNGVKNVRILVDSISSLEYSVKKAIENGLNISLEIQLSHSEIDSFGKIIGSIPQSINATIMLKDSFEDEELTKLADLLKKNISFRIKNDSLKTVGKSYGDVLNEEYSLSMFDCIFDFSNDSIPLGKEKSPIRLSECKSLDDYWNSKQFCKLREKVLKKLG